MATKFIINKGMDKDFKFTIKAEGSILGITLDPTDTFEFKLYRVCTDDLVSTIGMTASTDGQITLVDLATGKITLRINQELADTLVKETGDKVDGCYLKPTYRAVLTGSTVAKGEIVVKIPKVYVE